jgi:hypothetical protein
MGLQPSVPQEREVLLAYLNEAAEEVYDQSDPVGSLMEQAFKVNGDQTISMPSYIGQVRAIRELNTMIPWHINKMRPRYNEYNWVDVWRNIRLKGKSALNTTITNASKVIVVVSVVENPNIVVSISGSTLTASSVSEDIIVNVLNATSVNNYTEISSIKKDRVNTCDVAIVDVDGKQISEIPNNQLSAQYTILDVSQCPWLPQDTSVQDHYVEILYKKALPWLQNDDDEFPIPNYDNILVNKMLQLNGEESDKPDKAQLYDQKATRSMARKYEDANRETEDMVALVQNPHDNMFPRLIGSRRTRRYGRWSRY